FPNGNNYVINTSKVNIEPLNKFFLDKKWLKIIQNAKFEQKFIKYRTGADIVNTFDTMLAEGILTSNLYGTGLAALADKYLGITLDKEVRKSFGSVPMGAFSSEQLDYAAKDAEVLIPIYEKQKQALEEKSLTTVADVEFSVSQVVAAMELTGVPID